MNSLAYAQVLDYIDGAWDSLTFNSREGRQDRVSDWRHLAANSDDGHLDDVDSEKPHVLYLPNDFVSPGGRFPVQFYWDSFFIVQALIGTERHALARGMVENALFLVERHGMVIANRKRWSAGSQLPFLSQMVRAVFEVDQDQDWLLRAVPILEREYWGYWLDSAHLSYRGLSRYHAPPWFPAQHIAGITIDNEATWDLSPRFTTENVLNVLPVDLNSNLRVYEDNFSHFCEVLGDTPAAIKWRERSDARGQVMDELMWDSEKGLYQDFNFKDLVHTDILSLVSFFPMFYGHCSLSQADQVMSRLPMFEAAHGLKTCDRTYGYFDRQWNSPLGWAPLHYLAVLGMQRYGYQKAATRVSRKWLDLNASEYRRTGYLYEKYDVVSGTHDVLSDRYSNQRGFGWTNAVFAILARSLEKEGTVAP